MDSKQLLDDFIQATHLEALDAFKIVTNEIHDMLRTLDQILTSIKNKTDDIDVEKLRPLMRRYVFLYDMTRRIEDKCSSSSIEHVNEELDNINKMLDIIGEYCVFIKRHEL